MSDTKHKDALNDYFSSMFDSTLLDSTLRDSTVLDNALMDRSLATDLQKVTEDAEKEHISTSALQIENRDYSTIELDHQLTMTLDVFSQSIEQLNDADKIIASMELLMLLKQLPDSRVKAMLNERYQAIMKTSEAA